MHAVWGVAHLAVVTGDRELLQHCKAVFDWMLTRSTGTGWFPAGPENCNETCCISDMMSVAAMLGQGLDPSYYDAVDRYLRNYISTLQFQVTPAFEAMYRQRNQKSGEEAIVKGLKTLRKFQGGIIGGSGLNDYENVLLGGVSGFEMFGCCAPEGMRAIYTAWSQAIQSRPANAFGPAGVYINLHLNRESPWGRVVSFLPHTGRVTVATSQEGAFYIRRPHWAPKDQVRAFVDGEAVSPVWNGDYLGFTARKGQELTMTYPVPSFRHEVSGLWPNVAKSLTVRFEWLGNQVIKADPPATGTPLFSGGARILPSSPYGP
jgi:DUF1680 family protein